MPYFYILDNKFINIEVFHSHKLTGSANMEQENNLRQELTTCSKAADLAYFFSNSIN